MVKRLLRRMASVVLLLAVFPLSCYGNITIRTRLRAEEIQRLLDQAGLIGSPPGEVSAFLDHHGLQHLEYVKWSPDPATKRTMAAWTSRGLGVMLHPTMLVADGCVWIAFKFDETDRLKTFSVRPGIMSGFDV